MIIVDESGFIAQVPLTGIPINRKDVTQEKHHSSK